MRLEENASDKADTSQKSERHENIKTRDPSSIQNTWDLCREKESKGTIYFLGA